MFLSVKQNLKTRKKQLIVLLRNVSFLEMLKDVCFESSYNLVERSI